MRNGRDGKVGESNVLLGALGGIAYKTGNSKLRLTVFRLQNGESRAGQFDYVVPPGGVGGSDFKGAISNLEYKQRSLTNLFLGGEHVLGSGWKLDWRVSPTISTLDDPDIRSTTFEQNETSGNFSTNSGQTGFPQRIWRSLNEVSLAGKFDISKKYTVRGENYIWFRV